MGNGRGGVHIQAAGKGSGAVADRPDRKKSSGSHKPGFRWGRLAAVFLVYAFCLCILLPRPLSGLRVTCLDVGQGDGLVLECAAGVVMVDGGSSSRSGLGERCLEPYLESRAVEAIDYAVVSHGDSDHVSGLLQLMEGGGVRVKCLVLPRMGRGQEAYERLVLAAKACGAEVIYMEAEDRLRLGELELICLYAGNPLRETEEDKNRHSLVLRAGYGRFAMLFTGDMDAQCEAELLRTCAPGDLAGIQVLKAAHHGSATSSSPGLLDQLRPKIALVSYGKGNSYGHPSAEVLKRLRERGTRIWETAECGAVILTTDGEQVECRGWVK